VGSLLEVGTGFHLELTGRENIYLNGAILGMRRQEIESRFDEIVDFAGVEKFIDTPVKHYSSGMHLRLAFSVAAHLEPEILLVDEVLAVGDVAFQKKCLGKMGDVASGGRTVLFVSHNLGVIKELCATSIVIEQGRVSYRGSAVEGLARYSQIVLEDSERYHFNGAGWRGLRVNGSRSGMASIASGHEPIVVESWLQLGRNIKSGHLFLIMNDSIGNTIVHQRVSSEDLIGGGELPAGRHQLRVDLSALWLAPGVYSIYFKFIGHGTNGTEDRFFSERAVLDVHGSVNGISRAVLAPPVEWRFQRGERINQQSNVPPIRSTAQPRAKV
jgi:lipopolysaccharide transport system ATP-binding protein